MDLTRLIPYDLQVLGQVIGFYNAEIWPAHVVALSLILLATGLAARPPAVAGRAGDPRRLPGAGVLSDRIVLLVLAAAWLWTGLRYLGGAYAQLNWAGEWYSYAFALQAALLVLAAMAPPRFGARRDGWSVAGLVLAAFAVVGWPLLALAVDRPWAQIQVAGLTPDPTNLLTLALLLLARRPPLWLLPLPALWALLGVAWWAIAGAPDRMVLPALCVVAAGLLLWKRLRG